MNREIKFRAWNPETKTISYPMIIGINGENFSWDYNRDWLYNCQDWSGEEGYLYNPTLMQYTGLKDKNGVEVYEGDILQDQYGSKGVVKWISEQGGWDIFGWYFPASQLKTAEVIGNLYETPQLLTKNI